jgi:hypothetical protein
MGNEKEKIEWTEETVKPHLFKMVEVSDDNEQWLQKKLIGFSSRLEFPFVVNANDICREAYTYMRPIVKKKTIVEPWTFETCPWPLHVIHKDYKIAMTALCKEINFVTFCDSDRSYEYLINHFTMIDGSQCGIVKEVDA